MPDQLGAVAGALLQAVVSAGAGNLLAKQLEERLLQNLIFSSAGDLLSKQLAERLNSIYIELP